MNRSMRDAGLLRVMIIGMMLGRAPGAAYEDMGKIFSGWWFGTFLVFPYSGNNHSN